MIGILGGTFDPIHLGHLRMALELLEFAGLEEVRFIPCKEPVHKEAALVSAEHRLQMLRLAIDKQPGFVIDERELKRSTPSYMIETLEDLKKDFPDKSFGLILGSDALMQFTSWKRWEEILTLARLLVVPRQDFGVSHLPVLVQTHLDIHAIAALPLSSSNIRKALEAGQSVRYLVPDVVWAYITQHKLYR